MDKKPRKPRAEKSGLSQLQKWVAEHYPGYMTIPDWAKLKGVKTTTANSWLHAQTPLPHKVVLGGRRIIHQDTPTRFVRYRKEVKE